MQMPSAEMTEFAAYIDELTAATRAGNIEWSRANPSTFLWTVGPPTPTRISLQQVEQPKIEVALDGKRVMGTTRKYVFTLTDMKSRQQVLSIKSEDGPEISSKLRALFELIDSGVTRRGLDLLRSILPKP